jgi:SAM-dependent methyltransferase
MDEARKTNATRPSDFVVKYLSGRVIDIGSGRDLVCDWAERFDVEDGDANVITRHREVCAYDAVHSSHCLEHMRNPEAALSEWWSLIKPGGYMVLVVPDEDLYEQGIWPSAFNSDHKSTFRLGKPTSWSPASFDIREIVSRLPHCEIISADTQDTSYDYSLQRKHGDRNRPARGLWRAAVVCRMVPNGSSLLKKVLKLLFRCGVTIDQTLNDALAQIQVVARKTA